MSGHRLYYTLKPCIPWRLRIVLRRLRARRLRALHRDSWPILPSSARPPKNWRGWPEGRRFAFVLTHDVEGPRGLAKCTALAEVERELGFRSSFQFIPEGDYQVTPSQRAELIDQGFEVGVHDLHHDGSLYRNEATFRAQAPRIRHYLHEWKANGFRAGFMFHNLDWLHDLGAVYDMSTFDTDPFEPQNDGMGTLFPFHVPPPQGAPAGSPGYVELPYTLAQDSTLFLVLREQSPRLWIEKLDWIAAQGGMALLNVHPDYIAFDESELGPKTFPLAHYRTLLEHLRDRYAQQAWCALPGDLARFVKNQSTAA